MYSEMAMKLVELLGSEEDPFQMAKSRQCRAFYLLAIGEIAEAKKMAATSVSWYEMLNIPANDMLTFILNYDG